MENKRISDEEFMKNYVRHHTEESRSDRYVKSKGGNNLKIGYWIFLTIVFLLAYYLFSEFYFIPR